MLHAYATALRIGHWRSKRIEILLPLPRRQSLWLARTPVPSPSRRNAAADLLERLVLLVHALPLASVTLQLSDAEADRER